MRSSRWWAEDRYTKISRRRPIPILTRLTGITLPYRETILGNYLHGKRESAREIVRLISGWQTEGRVPPLGPDSAVLEPGCNCGPNLKAIHESFGCYLYGFDISTEALDLLRRVVLPGVPVEIGQGDALSTDWFDRFPDGKFDLVLTSGFLMHIPTGADKQAFVRTLLRIGRAVAFVEVWDQARAGTVEYAAGGDYCVAYEDYRRFGMTVTETPFLTAQRLRAYLRPAAS